MRKILLGRSTLEVSALCLGTDLIGSKINEEQSFALFDFFFENGGTFLDTANFYASWLPGCRGGESETTIGNWMRQRRNRDQVVLSSKLAFEYPGSPGGLTRIEIERECDKSLKRLGTDRIDLYQAHRDDRATSLHESMEAFSRLVKAGKVKALGASNLALWRIAEANVVSDLNGWPKYAAIEQRYTYLRPRHGADFGPQIFLTPEVKDYASVNEIGLIGYSVLLQGAYTRAEREIPAQFAGPDSNDRLAMLKQIANEAGCSINQAIIAWMRQSSPPVLPIIAASRIEQLKENIAAADIILSDEQIRSLNRAGDPVIERAWLQPS